MIFINAADRLLARLGINKQMSRIVARMSTAMLLRLMRITACSGWLLADKPGHY